MTEQLFCIGVCFKFSHYSVVLTDFGEGFDDYALEKQKNKFSSQITTMVTPNFYQV